MKKMWLFMLVGVLFCGGMAFSQGTPVTGEWFVYDDASNGGDSKITVTQVTEDGQTAYNYKGNTTKKYEYGFVGWGITPDAAGLKLISSMKNTSTITFKVKGDGRRYVLQFMDKKVKDYCSHEFVFNTTAGQVTTVSVQLRQLMQQAWGERVQLRPADVEKIQWQTYEGWRPNSFEITVWDVRINP